MFFYQRTLPSGNKQSIEFFSYRYCRCVDFGFTVYSFSTQHQKRLLEQKGFTSFNRCLEAAKDLINKTSPDSGVWELVEQ
jgi:hypothetical protein